MAAEERRWRRGAGRRAVEAVGAGDASASGAGDGGTGADGAALASAAIVARAAAFSRRLIVGGQVHPAVPQDPTKDGSDAAARHDGDGRHALLENANEANDKDGHGADLLYDDGRVSHQRPKVVGLEPRVSLEMLEKGGPVGVVVRIYRDGLD